MTRESKPLTPEQADAISKIAIDVARRRRLLGLTQEGLDQACGFVTATTYSVERGAVSPRRSFEASDGRVIKILATLSTIEADPTYKKPAPHGPAHRSKIHPRAQRAPAAPRKPEPKTLSAIIKRCPDQDVWITQAGCDGIRKTHRTCRSLRFGFGCKGVAHRRGLEKKEIIVEYTPPKPELVPVNRLRAEDWR